jgi:hypothetical protein
MSIETITDQMTLISLDVRIWSGRKKLRAEDLRRPDGPQAELPPDDLVSLGSKRVCNPDALNVFHRLKKQAERACINRGTRFLGGFAVPNEEVEKVTEEIERLRAVFQDERSKFLAAYDQEIESWVAQHPGWQEAIRNAIEPAEVVGGRLGFRYRPLRIAPHAQVRGTIGEDVAELGEGIFHEVAQSARHLEKSFLGKDELTQRALGTFRKVREKLAVVSFVDYRIQPVLEAIEDWLERVPRNRAIKGALFNEGFGLMLLVSDPKRMAAHGEGRLALQELIPQSTTPAALQEPSLGHASEPAQDIDFFTQEADLPTDDEQEQPPSDGWAISSSRQDTAGRKETEEEAGFFF